jgi:hypothetical protein
MATDTPSTTSTVPVTADNFIRAETDKYFGDFVKRGALGKLWHFRELPSIDLDSVRPNRDTLYSHAVFDLEAGTRLANTATPSESTIPTTHGMETPWPIERRRCRAACSSRRRKRRLPTWRA